MVESVDIPPGAQQSTACLPGSVTPLVVVLSEEHVELTRTVEPYERVTVTVENVESDIDVEVSVDREHVTVDQTPTPRTTRHP